MPPPDRHVLTGPAFFPHLISEPFLTGLHVAFAFAIVACLVAAAASLMRGGRYYHGEKSTPLTHRLPKEQLAG